MKYVTYNDMVMMHGKRPAFNLLRTIERLTHIRDEIISLDMEARFERAFDALCKTDFA